MARFRSVESDGIGADDTQPGLLKKHSSNVSYTISVATYPSIRTFFVPHPHIDKLPSEPSVLPLLVFVHGLGGSVAQFHPLLISLANIAPCFGIDLPGCGLSSFAPTDWESYKIEALVELLATAIETYRDKKRNQKVILVGHSLGCSISASLASSRSSIKSDVQNHIIGLISICPAAGPPPRQLVHTYRRLLYIPDPLFNVFRWWDRRGGIESASVVRFVGNGASPETRQLQLRFNSQSRTPVWRRMAWGTLPTSYSDDDIAKDGMAGAATWAGVRVPVLLVGGEADPVTKPEEVTQVMAHLGVPAGDMRKNTMRHGRVEAFIFPTPASHGLLYEPSTSRSLAGLAQEFLAKQVDARLDLGLQLQQLTTTGKWDVKNVEKWRAVAPVSAGIGGGMFVAMKTLRDADEGAHDHCPAAFVRRWRGRVAAVIDISHGSPVYDSSVLDRGGITYIKLPTVSKVPPTPDEVRDFVALAVRLETELLEASKSPASGEPSSRARDGADEDADADTDAAPWPWPRPAVGVHCHYGFNRTGFFICAYLIEKKGYGVQEALDEFARCRPPGIRHDHFVDTMYMRYHAGLRPASG